MTLKQVWDALDMLDEHRKKNLITEDEYVMGRFYLKIILNSFY